MSITEVEALPTTAKQLTRPLLNKVTFNEIEDLRLLLSILSMTGTTIRGFNSTTRRVSPVVLSRLLEQGESWIRLLPSSSVVQFPQIDVYGPEQLVTTQETDDEFTL